MNPPTQFRFELDSWCYEYGAVELQAGELVCRLGDPAARFTEPFTVKPTAERWLKFWQAVNAAGVWRWERDYSNPILDGTSWALELDWGGKRITSHGCNGFPPTNATNYTPDSEFGIFAAAVRKLVKRYGRI